MYEILIWNGKFKREFDLKLNRCALKDSEVKFPKSDSNFIPIHNLDQNDDSQPLEFNVSWIISIMMPFSVENITLFTHSDNKIFNALMHSKVRNMHESYLVQTY